MALLYYLCTVFCYWYSQLLNVILPALRFPDSAIQPPIKKDPVAGGLDAVIYSLHLDSVIVKRSTNRYKCFIRQDWREAKFYSWTRTPHFLLPHVYASKFSKWTGEYAICMEDLNAKGGARLGWYLFNQMDIWGPRSAEANKRAIDVSPEACLDTLFTQLGQFHSTFWNDSSLLKVDWLKGVNWFTGHGQAQWQANLDHARTCWETARSFRKRLDPTLVARMDASLMASSWDEFQSNMTRFSLCHGDFHAGNIIIMDKNTFKWVDWSEVGVGDPFAVGFGVAVNFFSYRW